MQATYDRLLAVLPAIGPFAAEPRKPSIHLIRTPGFVGVHLRKRSLILNLRTAQRIQSARAARVAQISPNRYHNEIKLKQSEAVDAEIVGWLREAYALGA